jgi:hypothetical protein
MDIQKLNAIQKKHEKALIKKKNVVSIGCGYKFKNGKQTDKIGIIIGVSKKLPVSALSTKDKIPSSLDGVLTDVLEIGVVKANEIDPTKKFRPAPPGVSIGHKDITAGTFGCVVYRNDTKLILSNNHVLANSNDAQFGDSIYQPGPIDGGTSFDKIGTLFDFVPIQFQGDGGGTEPTCPVAKGTAGTANLFATVLRRKHRLVAFNTEPLAVTNKVDCALALPDNPEDITDEITEIGKPTNVADAPLGTPVQKYGRTTQYTTGNIIQTNVTVQVSYGPGKIATFTEQLMAGAMSAGGDSGSATLNMNNELIGLLYAGSDATTIFNPINEVFAALNVNL